MSYSVVIPVLNAAPWVTDTLRTVFAQTMLPDDVIVVDNGSTDGTCELVRTFPGVRLIYNFNEQAPTAPRHWGFLHTTSPLIAFLDADDLWHPEHAERLCDALRAIPRVPAAACRVESFRDGSAPVWDVTPQGSDFVDPWDTYPLATPVPTPSAVMIRRWEYERAGGWDEKFWGVEDYHLWLRLCVREPLLRMRARTTARRVHRTSFLHRLLAADAVGRLERRAMASEDAGSHRLAAVSSDQERDVTLHRMRLARHMAGLARAAVAGDDAALRESALGIESAITGESEARLLNLFVFLHFSLCSGSDPARGYRRIFGTLMERWPAEAPETRRALRSFIAIVPRLSRLAHPA